MALFNGRFQSPLSTLAYELGCVLAPMAGLPSAGAQRGLGRSPRGSSRGSRSSGNARWLGGWAGPQRPPSSLLWSPETHSVDRSRCRSPRRSSARVCWCTWGGDSAPGPALSTAPGLPDSRYSPQADGASPVSGDDTEGQGGPTPSPLRLHLTTPGLSGALDEREAPTPGLGDPGKALLYRQFPGLRLLGAAPRKQTRVL